MGKNTFLISGIILVAAWLLALAVHYTLGGAIHLLLIIGGALIVAWLLRRNRDQQ